MDHFLAVSLRRDQRDQDSGKAWVARGRASLARICGRESLDQLDAGSAGEVFIADSRDRVHTDGDGNWCHIFSPGVFSQSSGTLYQSAELLALAQAAGSLREFAKDLAPPFGALLMLGSIEATVAFCDSRGLHHVYYVEDDGMAMLSSSCLALARAVDATLDLACLGTFALTGSYLGDSTPFREVRKLEAGHLACLADGTLQFEDFASFRASDQDRASDQGASDHKGVTPPSFAEAVHSGQAMVKGRVGICLQAAPDAAVELSGGLDSRLILAAIESDSRQGRLAVTLSYPGSEDLAVAVKIVAATGMEHRIADLSQLSMLSSEQALALTREAARACEYCSNPFSRGVLRWVDEKLGGVARLTGQNGEFARGFYYPGQADGPVTRARAESLARWRIAVNESVDVSQLDDTFHVQAMSTCISKIEQEMLKRGRSWMDATDEYYLANRMGRGAGTGYTAAQIDRTILAPFFHDEFIDWARGLPNEHKAHGRVIAGLVRALDSKLSHMPLDSGRTPDTMQKDGLGAKVQRGVDFGKKVFKKAKQRLLQDDKIAVGAADLTRGVLNTYASVEEMAPKAVALGIVSESCARTRPQSLSSNTAGFLLNVEWILESLA